jgi:hypothetical protein
MCATIGRLPAKARRRRCLITPAIAKVSTRSAIRLSGKRGRRQEEGRPRVKAAVLAGAVREHRNHRRHVLDAHQVSPDVAGPT